MNEFDIINIVAKPEEKPDPLFSFDAAIGKVLNVLATIGVFCAFVAGCFFWGYIK